MISLAAALARLFFASRRGNDFAARALRQFLKLLGAMRMRMVLHFIRANMNSPAEAKARLGNQALIKGVSIWFLPSHWPNVIRK